MKRIRIIAIISAIVTALAVYLYLASVKKPEAVLRAPVVVATQKISAGKVITADMVAVKNLPVEAINGQAARSVDEVVGRVSSADIETDEQMLVSRFYRAGDTNNDTLAYALEPGKRAVTIAVDPVAGVSGLVKPRDHVDILVTVTVRRVVQIKPYLPDGMLPTNPNDLQYTMTEPVDVVYSLLPLQNVLVLATGQVMQANATNEQTTVEQVTLSVTPDQAVLLNYIASDGCKIRLALRSPIDTGTVNVAPKTIDDIIPVNSWEDVIEAINKTHGKSGATAKPGATPKVEPTPTPAPTSKK